MYHIGWSLWQKKSSKCPLSYAPVVAECPSRWVFEIGESPSTVTCFIQDLSPCLSAPVGTSEVPSKAAAHGTVSWSAGILGHSATHQHEFLYPCEYYWTCGIYRAQDAKCLGGNWAPPAGVTLQFSNVERAGFSNPHDETSSPSSCQEDISKHGGQQNSPACHRHSEFDGLSPTCPLYKNDALLSEPCLFALSIPASLNCC